MFIVFSFNINKRTPHRRDPHLIDPQNTHPFQCSVLFSNSTLTIIPKKFLIKVSINDGIEVCVFLELAYHSYYLCSLTQIVEKR